MLGRALHLLRSRIALKLTLTLVGFVAVSTLVAGLYLSRGLERVAVEAVEARLATAARVLHDEARAALRTGATQPFAERVARPAVARVTLIAPDGRVLADSERTRESLASMENHADRPEVRAALAGGMGRDVRRSATLGAPLIYVAVPVSEAGRIVAVLRLAAPVEAATPAYESLRAVMLTGGAIALLVALGIGLFVAGRVTRPVVEMQFDAFAYPAFEQVTSHLAKLGNRTRGRIGLPIVVRIPYGGGIGGVKGRLRA